MMSIRHLRLLAGKLAIVLALLLALEPLLRVESQATSLLPLARLVEQASRSVPTANATLGQAEQAGAINATGPWQSAQQAVDLAVRRSLMVMGWQVTALSGQL